MSWGERLMRMKPTRGRALASVGLVLASAIACSPESEEPPRANRPAQRSEPPSAQHTGLCQPFPDRLIDDFRAAYNDRELEELQTLVSAEPIEDVVAAAYEGDATFDTVREWAEAGWRVDDRIDLTGYTAFHPTKRGFQINMTRRSDALRDRGITAAATTLDAISRGCSIESLEMSGIVQAKGRPCAFYDAFGAVADVAANEPLGCRDGSGDHARTDHVGAWTGDRALVWGGHRGGYFTYLDAVSEGLSFDPHSAEWERLPPPPLPAFTPQVGVWTGAELLVAGGRIRGHDVVAAAYGPAVGSWRVIDVPYQWSGFTGVWTGRKLLIWGGDDHAFHPRRRGAVYDPASGTWRKTSPAPIGGRWWHAAVWTGTEMIVWGGTNPDTDLADGAAYDPSTDTWRKLAPAPISSRQWTSLVWTGREVIVWGGSSYSNARGDGAAYDPASDSWRKLPPAPITGRYEHSATWTGSEVIVFGGYDYHRTFRDGAAYDPVADSWRRISRAPIAPRAYHSAVWTETALFVFGGTHDFGAIALGDGALYDPAANTWRRVIPSP